MPKVSLDFLEEAVREASTTSYILPGANDIIPGTVSDATNTSRLRRDIAEPAIRHGDLLAYTYHQHVKKPMLEGSTYFKAPVTYLAYLHTFSGHPICYEQAQKDKNHDEHHVVTALESASLAVWSNIWKNNPVKSANIEKLLRDAARIMSRDKMENPDPVTVLKELIRQHVEGELQLSTISNVFPNGVPLPQVDCPMRQDIDGQIEQIFQRALHHEAIIALQEASTVEYNTRRPDWHLGAQEGFPYSSSTYLAYLHVLSDHPKAVPFPAPGHPEYQAVSELQKASEIFRKILAGGEIVERSNTDVLIRKAQELMRQDIESNPDAADRSYKHPAEALKDVIRQHVDETLQSATKSDLFPDGVPVPQMDCRMRHEIDRQREALFQKIVFIALEDAAVSSYAPTIAKAAIENQFPYAAATYIAYMQLFCDHPPCVGATKPTAGHPEFEAVQALERIAINVEGILKAGTIVSTLDSPATKRMYIQEARQLMVMDARAHPDLEDRNYKNLNDALKQVISKHFNSEFLKATRSAEFPTGVPIPIIDCRVREMIDQQEKEILQNVTRQTSVVNVSGIGVSGPDEENDDEVDYGAMRFDG